MSSITFNIDNLREDGAAPLFHKYPSQTNPQGAYIEIDEDGEVTADWNGEIGNAIPFSVFHERTIRIGVRPTVSGEALASFLESTEGMLLLERIHDGRSIEWDGNNHVGIKSEDCDAAIREIEEEMEGLESIEVYSAEEWLENDTLEDCWPRGVSIDKAAEDCASNTEPGQMIYGDMVEALVKKAREKYSTSSEAAEDGREEVAKAMDTY